MLDMSLPMNIVKTPNKSFQPTARRTLWVNALAKFKCYK